jgi:hypothetical protein
MEVRVVRLGQFVILSHGRDTAQGPYLDMVFLGDPSGFNMCAAAVQP